MKGSDTQSNIKVQVFKEQRCLCLRHWHFGATAVMMQTAVSFCRVDFSFAQLKHAIRVNYQPLLCLDSGFVSQ